VGLTSERIGKDVANKRSISRLLSLMLRHRPDEFGLEIDEYGFAPLDQVIQAVQERYEEVTEEDILELVQAPNQRRFELTEQGIRALYGHSFFVDMDGEPMDPPERLYMGTTFGRTRRFREEGIKPGDRYYVHLSLSRQAAEERSREPDAPCVVEIQAKEASENGVEFYARGEVVLTREIPPQFIGEIHGGEADGKRGERGWKRPEESTFGRKPRKVPRL